MSVGRDTVNGQPATITGTGAAKVSTTVSYSPDGKDLIINVTTNFAASNQIVVSGLKFTTFTAISAASNLGLITGGGGPAPVVATDTKTIQIVAPTLTGAANQVFVVGAASTAMSTATTPRPDARCATGRGRHARRQP